MRRIILVVLLAAPAPFAQYQGQDQSKSEGYKPSAETPASKKRETRITAKFRVRRATNQGRPLKSSPRQARLSRATNQARGNHRLAVVNGLAAETL
jgi:hypothetical protein